MDGFYGVLSQAVIWPGSFAMPRRPARAQTPLRPAPARP
jgi:hypothetical protein